ncbi:MAG: ABC transporter ATP-binding protein [bacterium]|nr:ABC transporter ATP-binding protein [bacterium]
MTETTDERDGRLGLKALWPYFSLLRGQKLHIAAALVLMLAATGISLAVPLAAGSLVDTFGSELATVPRGRTLVVLGGLLVAQLIGSFLFTVVSSRLGLRTVTRLRKRVYAHLLELPSLFFTGQKAGDLSSRVTSDVGSIQYMLTDGLVALSRSLLTLAGALILMLGINPRLTVVVLLLIPSTILLVRIFGRRLQKLSRRMYDDLGRINSHVQETVSAIRSLKVYNNQNHEQGRFADRVDSYRDAGIRRVWHSAALESAVQFSLWLCLIAIVIYGFALAARGATSGGELVAFLLLAFRVAVPLASLTGLFSSAQGAVAAAGRLNDIFSLEPEREPGARVPAPQHGARAVTLAGVGFRYPGDGAPQVLEGLDVEIPAGARIGIVGPSGGGKTTLIGLVMGLFPPSSGQLRLDGVPYADHGLAELRSHMAFVAQEPFLHDLSLRENIRFGLAAATDAEIETAATKAGVTEFSAALPEDLDTVCGERGARLSGGQRQRVALARAFLRDPGILILDEPTSALDAAAEDRIRRTMQELMAGRTTIVISHRFSLVRDLDLILVLRGGSIVEQGTHAELVSLDGLYRRLFELQQGDLSH